MNENRMAERKVLAFSPRAGVRKPIANCFPRLRPRTAQGLGSQAGETTASGETTRITTLRPGRTMDITWLTERIALGGGIWTATNMDAVKQAGITHILDMQIEFDDTPLAREHGIAVCWNPIDDDFEPKPAEVFERGVEFALRALGEAGAKIFIHCAAGVHRAPMMTLAVLCVLGWKLEDGVDLIESKREAADFADVYVESVENYLAGRKI